MQKLTASIFVLLIAAMAHGQLEPLTNQYLFNTLSINPAYAGSRGALSVVMLHRNQWAGFEGAPKTVSIGLHAPTRNDRVGLGLLAVNDRRGISTSNIITGNFAFRIYSEKGVLSMGLAGGFTFARNDWNSLVAVDRTDDLFLVESRGYLLPDFSLGTYYQSERFFFGLSLPMFLAHSFNPASNTFNLENNYRAYNFFLNTGYLFKPSSTIKLLPSMLMRYNTGTKPQADLNLHLILLDLIQTGISYRSNRSVVGSLMYHVNNQLAIAYSYDLGFGKTGGYLGSSHEIMIRYDFRYVVDVMNPRYF